METYTIPAERWMQFFDGFNRDHLGWPVTIEVLDEDFGPQHIAENLPLQGISFDTKGTRSCSIEIGAGDQLGVHMTHVIDMPLHIRQAQERNGDIDLQIEPAKRPVTLIHLRGPVRAAQ
jgi:hypothetical protein